MGVFLYYFFSIRFHFTAYPSKIFFKSQDFSLTKPTECFLLIECKRAQNILCVSRVKGEPYHRDLVEQRRLSVTRHLIEKHRDRNNLAVLTLNADTKWVCNLLFLGSETRCGKLWVSRKTVTYGFCFLAVPINLRCFRRYWRNQELL